MTRLQANYIRDLQRKLHIADHSFDDYCHKQFGLSVANLTKADASRLLNDMIEWKEIPAELQRAMGQLDLFSAMSQ